MSHGNGRNLVYESKSTGQFESLVIAVRDLRFADLLMVSHLLGLPFAIEAILHQLDTNIIRHFHLPPVLGWVSQREEMIGPFVDGCCIPWLDLLQIDFGSCLRMERLRAVLTPGKQATTSITCLKE